jgi:nitroreductase
MPFMNKTQRIIQERQSARVLFDPNRKISKENLEKILDVARWSPTAHNMQNFDVVVVDDAEVLGIIGPISFCMRAASSDMRQSFSLCLL